MPSPRGLLAPPPAQYCTQEGGQGPQGWCEEEGCGGRGGQGFLLTARVWSGGRNPTYSNKLGEFVPTFGFPLSCRSILFSDLEKNGLLYSLWIDNSLARELYLQMRS
jgi:hypothetical protein